MSRTTVTRLLLAPWLAFCACAGKPGPTLMRTVSSLPDDPQRRSEQLDSSQARPGPENQPRSAKARRVETTAATMAAIAGMIFSKSSSVVLGVGGPVDENLVVDPDARTRKRPAGSEGGDGDSAAARPATQGSPDASRLVPWIKLAPRTGAPDAPTAPAGPGTDHQGERRPGP